jgi:hypothetical protein
MRSRIKIARDPFDQVDPINNKKLFKMPYTRAYQVPVQEIAVEAAQLNIEETPTRLKPMLNITPSSNWIQETFYARDIVVVEIEKGEETIQVKRFIIEKAERASLYQRLIDMQTRTRLFRVTMVASNPVPNTDTIKKFIEEANGDNSKLVEIRKDWEARIIQAVAEGDFTEFIDTITEETVYLRADLFQEAGLESIRLTILSPELPTRGDTPITAILYSPTDETAVDATTDTGIRGETEQPVPIGVGKGESIPFSWTDRSGFVSTITIFPNVIYEIQPVSVDFKYPLTLLA